MTHTHTHTQPNKTQSTRSKSFLFCKEKMEFSLSQPTPKAHMPDSIMKLIGNASDEYHILACSLTYFHVTQAGQSDFRLFMHY